MNATSTSEDSVYWINNVLEFTDDGGTHWRYERSGPDGAWTDVRIYQNGVHRNDLKLSYDASANLDGYRLLNAGDPDWMETNYDGDIETTSAGGNPDRIKAESVFDPTERCSGGRPTGDVGIQTHNDCQAEYDTMQSEAWDAALSTGLASVIMAFNQPVGLMFAGAAAGEVLEAGVALAGWAQCKLQ